MKQLAESFYKSRVNILEIELKSVSRRFFLLFLSRLISFIGFCAFLVWFTVWPSAVWLPLVSVIFMMLFLFVVRMDLKLVHYQKTLQDQLQTNKDELKYLKYEYNEFDDGREFTGINPHLAEDFDLFGESSLFQYLNRATTKAGRMFFAEQLCQWDKNSTLIKQKQVAIEELSGKHEFMEEFQSAGRTNKETGNELGNLLKWLNEPGIKAHKFRWLLIGYPLLLGGWIVLTAVGVLAAESLLIPFGIAFWFTTKNSRIVNKAHNSLGKSAKTVAMFENLIHLIENETFHAPFLNNEQQKLFRDEFRAGQSLKALFKILNRFDYRYNMIAGVLLNVTYLFDLQMLNKLELWKRTYKDYIPQWFEVLNRMDALIGFARYTMNNQSQVVFPEVVEDGFVFEANEMGHPLIVADTRVNNHVVFRGQPKIMVVTGANMAGKSTFLRTLAVNLILAVNGAPVCARSLRFTPCDIMSSIHIRDSLSHKASYFYSELLRIREIIDHVQKQPKTLVILDEILRGTNTKDKQAGSAGLLKKMISLNAVVVIATHDLTIGELENTFPEIVSNYCFEVELEDDQLIFDYKLKNGVSKKLNASFLMKKMGVIE